MVIDPKDIYCNLVQFVADGLIVSDASGSITDCNAAFTRLIKTEPKDILGNKISTFIECSCLEGNDGHFDALSKSFVVSTTENNNLHNASILCSGQTNMVMPINHMIIHNSNHDLLGYLTVVYIVQANSVQQAQTEFVSTVSHELRTPLTSIKGFADTILRAGDRLDTSQQRRYIGIIKDQADRLTRLVEDLLAVSRLESRKLQLTIRAVDLHDTVQRVLRNLQDKSDQHQLIMQIPPGLIPVWADADRLEQILTNLIENAIKYSPPSTTVSINAKELDQDMVEFSVSDQGVGIPQEHLPEIFSKFSRLDNPLVRQTEGTGLGLYITKSLVLALGGDIRVSSSPIGTIFTVQLPAATLEKQAALGRGT